MKKLAFSLVAGLTFLSSVSSAKDIDFFVKRSHDIVQVANKGALKKNKGDVFYRYQRGYDKWILEQITKAGRGYFTFKPICYDITENEIPTYVDGIQVLYYDKDPGEEDLVAVFYQGVDSKVKEAWIEKAKKYLEMIN